MGLGGIHMQLPYTVINMWRGIHMQLTYVAVNMWRANMWVEGHSHAATIHSN